MFVVLTLTFQLMMTSSFDVLDFIFDHINSFNIKHKILDTSFTGIPTCDKKCNLPKFL